MSGSGNGANFTSIAEIVFSIAIDRKELEKGKLERKWNEWKWKWYNLHYDRRDQVSSIAIGWTALETWNAERK